jgi:cobalt-precorrin-5B (C1)-methyltransferase
VVGGLSILGTSGIVRPFSNTALRDALKCSVDVAHACGIEYPVLTPGRIGEKAARARFRLTPQQIIEAGNEWGFILDECARAHFRAALVVGHAGKLAKLIGGHWDTHSSRSPSALPIVTRIYEEQFGASAPESVTVEGLFGALPPTERSALAVHVAEGVAKAVKQRLGQDIPISVMLVNLQGRELGVYGDVSQWAILESQS